MRFPAVQKIAEFSNGEYLPSNARHMDRFDDARINELIAECSLTEAQIFRSPLFPDAGRLEGCSVSVGRHSRALTMLSPSGRRYRSY